MAMAFPISRKRITNNATDPNNADTDGDGVRDGVDLNPAYKMNDLVQQGTPTIDGTISPSEGWSVLTDKWGYVNKSLVTDDNDRAALSTTYAAWDENYMYLALRGPAGNTDVELNGNDEDNFSIGPADYYMTFRNSSNFRKVAINAGVPDLYRQLDNAGAGGSMFDTDPYFARPYMGRTPSNNPTTDGLGFASRLVTGADLTYQYHANGNDSVWEVRIPWSNVTQLRGFAGKEMAINFNSEGDVFFESDASARIRLVESGAAKPIINLSNSTVSYQENAGVSLLSPTGSVSDNDSYDLQGGVLQIAIVAGNTPNDRLSIFSSGTATGQISVNNGRVLYGGVVVGTFSGGIGTTPLTITLKQQATLVVTQAILRSIAFRSVGDAVLSGSRTVQFTLSDGDGQTSSPVTMTIDVKAANDAPVLDKTKFVTLPTINEDSTNSSGALVSNLLAGAVTDADPSALHGMAVATLGNTWQGTWQYSLNSGANWQDFGTPSNGAARLLPSDSATRVRFVPKANLNGQVKFSYYAWDQTQGVPGGTLDVKAQACKATEAPSVGNGTMLGSRFCQSTMLLCSISQNRPF